MSGPSRSKLASKKKTFKTVKRMVRRKVVPKKKKTPPKRAPEPSQDTELSQDISSEDGGPEMEHQELLQQLLSKMSESSNDKTKKREAKLKSKAKGQLATSLEKLGNDAMKVDKREQVSLTSELKGADRRLKELHEQLETEKRKNVEKAAKSRRQITVTLDNLQTMQMERQKKLVSWEKQGQMLDFADITKLVKDHDRRVAKITNSETIKLQLQHLIQEVF
jgi:hypothetical protein